MSLLGQDAHLTYKAINTLDWVIGYRDKRYLFLAESPLGSMMSRT
jgi:cobalamin biosynthesis protein CobD/CbiB